MKREITGYIIQAEGAAPFDITSSEYEAFMDALRENRAEKVREEIFRLADAFGVATAKNLVRGILKELED